MEALSALVTTTPKMLDTIKKFFRKQWEDSYIYIIDPDDIGANISEMLVSAWYTKVQRMFKLEDIKNTKIDLLIFAYSESLNAEDLVSIAESNWAWLITFYPGHIDLEKKKILDKYFWHIMANFPLTVLQYVELIMQYKNRWNLDK